ncbi:hypothetical protein HELRODRAFT_157327 [Helobdella robusta]|uniref:U3 small nucleolar RNA-associated protein 11 n=1 Tax=Helobdella robusta TaxID=6412 RepID=T1EM98_HELRO|nr:hypothetical protein HELRODRAFT_157327 [Helobdella robusta]ESO00541.1 hypothetical protein HELRODRAFT_157327 [Helobdella robusta]
MATAFRNAAKSYQKVHRERSQLKSREHLGFLEKKKDYKRRTEEHHKKLNTLKFLKRKALDKNPDEFYFNMVRSKLVDGEHKADDKIVSYTDDQLKLMESQDIKYVQHKRSIEKKKIERLKASLQLFDIPYLPKNEHVIFLDSKREVETFDPAKYFNTLPELVNRSYNRPTLETLKNSSQFQIDDRILAEATVEKEKKYGELVKRIEREKQLAIVESKLSMKKLLIDKSVPKKKVAEETVDSAAVYRWVFKRKR